MTTAEDGKTAGREADPKTITEITVGDALVAKLKTETVNFLVWSYRMEEPKNLRDAWKQKHEVLLSMNAICDKDLSRTSRTSRTSMLKNNE